MMRKHKDLIELSIFGIGVFFFLAAFFLRIHPLVIFDTDDWLYIYYPRHALPQWGIWNPIKVFPEVLMPFFSQIGVTLFCTGAENYIQALTFIHGLVVSAFIFVYIMEFVLLIRNRFHAGTERSIVIGCLFLLFHFLIFRKFSNENGHLFFSANVTCYYNYLLPNIFNCTLVMQFMRNDVVKDWWKPTDFIKKGIIVLLVYFAIFSNLFSSVILVAYVGTMLLWELVSMCKEQRFQLIVYIRENGIRLIVILAWGVSQIFEINGGRAGAAESGSLLSGIVDTVKILWQWIYKINYRMKWFALVILIIYAVTVIRNRKNSLTQSYLTDIWKLLLSMAFAVIYLVLLCAKVSASYIARYDEILAIAYWELLIIGICINYILEQYKNLMIIMPLLTVILFSEINTPGNTFKDVNTPGLSYEICIAVDEDIINQFVAADENGDTELVVYVPVFDGSENWPIATYAGGRFAEALSEHGITSKTMYVKEVVPSTDKNEQFHLEY